MKNNRKIPKQSGDTDMLRDKDSKSNGPPFYFWKWLGETHPVIDFLVWLSVLGMSMAALFISIISKLR